MEQLHGIHVRIPDEAERTVVHDVIYDELVRGVVRDESRERYLAVIDHLVERGCAGHHRRVHRDRTAHR